MDIGHKPKIVLFSANPRYAGPPLGLLSITKLIDLDRYDVKIITHNEFPNFDDEVLKQCEGALTLGMSVISGYPVKIAKIISQKVKAKYPNLPIIWGGWQTTTLPEVTLSSDFVDYICMGQGERTFKMYIDAIASGDLSQLDKIPRLGYKKDGKVILNQRTGTEEIDSLPEFNFDLINWNKYYEMADFGKKVIRMTTSYGCPYRCAFCCEPLNSKRIWKSESADKIINYIKELRKRVEFDGLMIVDSNFFVNEERVIQICKGFIDNNFNIKFGQVNGRTNNLVKYKPETWELLKKAGLYNILIGAESSNEDTLNFINKDATVEDTLKLSDICNKYGILLIASVIVGLPTEKYFEDNKKAFEEDLNGVIDLYHKMCTNGSTHHLLTFPYAPLPFSPLYEKAIELGFKPPVTLDEWSDYEFTTVHVPWIPDEGFKKIVVLNHISMLVGINFKYLLNAFPLYFKILAKPAVNLFIFIARLRFKYKYLDYPIDMQLFNLGIKFFGYANKRLKMVAIGGGEV